MLLRRARGISLLELLVGMTIGLLLLLAVSGLLVNLLGSQARERRQIRLGAMVDASLSLMAMELRRAGYWDSDGGAGTNPYGRIYIEQSGHCLRYGYDTPPNQPKGGQRYFAFRLKLDDAQRGRLQRLSADEAGWKCDAADAKWDDLSKPDIGIIDTLRFTEDRSDHAIGVEVAAHTPPGGEEEKLDIRTSIALRNRPAVEVR
ncbi:hypothetical protein BI347_09795 [Chromobacterium sphagni]|uniref:Prepilin-type N-terminal cleavage/methylation domain-containing protein n=1 Tax=Chromobacterium sphagni TaxID=1903179 RepID=A0A1S1X2Z0_9NEIS|nr:prepilin-type N-terminal cleavage/methylation domain-containing protein [Chromobacterium sphagni]OHX13770.1 hypothetical protein BI347_09795 [Chromobacterium sphagni]